jgi:hypothetical protein
MKAKAANSDRPKRRVWSVEVILVDMPPLIKGTKKQDKFLVKKELLRSLKVSTGYGKVTPSVVDARIVLT